MGRTIGQIANDLSRPMVIFVDYIGTNDWGVWVRRYTNPRPEKCDKPTYRGLDPLMLTKAAVDQLTTMGIQHTIHWSDAAQKVVEMAEYKPRRFE